MEISTRRIGTSLLLDVVGQIKGADSNEFRAVVKRFLEAGESDLVINLEQVGFIDSSGVGMLIHCLHEVRAHHGDLRLVKLTEDIHDLFEMVAIDRLFTIYPSEEEILPLQRKS
ncbi:MAG: STAS domain-containing protein [Fibrobacterota bacterium]|nr:STAS domain-containing protein [Fibrobacterota bacterium]QQS03106.1 MAG: STAS domain-containing protein [Fibrobacterota bacterium]